MSLGTVSGKVRVSAQEVARITSSLGTQVSSLLYGDFKNRDEESFSVSGLQSSLEKFASLAGYRKPEYIIGRIETQSDTDGLNLYQKATRAITTFVSQSGQEKGVIIDGYDNVKGELRSALPSQPVMYNTSITNTRVRQPDVLTMRVYVTNINTDDIIDNIAQTLSNSLGGVKKLVLGSEQTRVQRALSNLEWIKDYGKPFKVYTTHKVYENMLIQSILPVNDQKTNDMLVADITFKEIIFSKSLNGSSNVPARTKPSEIISTLASKWF